MKPIEIGTIAMAGVISLAALLLLDRDDSDLISSQALESLPSEATFEDTSTMVEFSVPAPTPDPPLEQGPVLLESTDGDTPIAVPVNADSQSIAQALAAPAIEERRVGDIPIDDELNAGYSEVDGQLDNLTEPGDSFEDTFVEAVEKASADNTPVPQSYESTATTAEGEEDRPPSIIEETPTGFWLRDARLNDVFQHLAQLANMQFFHNADLNGPQFVVTGQLMEDDPIKQMEELSLMYGITIHKKGNTVYALTAPQLTQLPTQPFRYQLKYLRPSDIEQIKLILQPFLTPGSGIIEYETKTNTLIVLDNERKLEALAMFLDEIDQPKEQIAIETRILRVRSSSENRLGVDWTGVLGESGTSVGASASLNSLFNLPEMYEALNVLTTGAGGQTLDIISSSGISSPRVGGEAQNNDESLVLSPVQLRAVLRALNEGGLAQQESSPTLITEDNEEALISIIDRVPIITATVVSTSAGQNVTEDVRYVIDESDPVGDPATTREVGVSVAVTPTILPDNTIRMVLRPRSAQITNYVQGSNGNSYPRVNESTVTTIARVPNGHSLLIGGFYEEAESEGGSKIPLLGDIPAVGLLFKSSETIKTQTSLVFIVTPKLYQPALPLENDLVSHEIHDSHVLPGNYNYPDSDNPGSNHKSNFKNTVNNMFNRYEPEAPSNLLLPAHPYNNPESPQPSQGVAVAQSEPDFANPAVTVRPANASGSSGNSGFLGKLFGGNKNRAR